MDCENNVNVDFNSKNPHEEEIQHIEKQACDKIETISEANIEQSLNSLKSEKINKAEQNEELIKESQIDLLTQENIDFLNKKLEEIFTENLTNLISKFTSDIEFMESMKYGFSDMYYELEKIKHEINMINSKKNIEHSQSNYSSNTVRNTETNASSISINSKGNKPNKAELQRSKTPTKIKTTRTLEPKELQSKQSGPTKLDVTRNLNTDRSRTPTKIIKGKVLNSNNYNTENPNKAKYDKKPMENKAEASKARLNTTGVGKAQISKPATNSNSNMAINAIKKNPPPINKNKRDMTPTIKKTKPNLDTSTISNLDNSIFKESQKGNQTQKNKNSKITVFSTKRVDKGAKANLNNTVIEDQSAVATSKKILATGKNAIVNSKPAVNKMTASALKNGVHSKVNNNIKSGNKEADPATEVDADILLEGEDEEEDPEKNLKKDSSITNIMDIIAEKNKEVNIEEILSKQKTEKDDETPIAEDLNSNKPHEDNKDNNEHNKLNDVAAISSISNNNIHNNSNVEHENKASCEETIEIKNNETPLEEESLQTTMKETQAPYKAKNPKEMLLNSSQQYANIKNMYFQYIIKSR